MMPEQSDPWYARPAFFVNDGRAALTFYCRLGFAEAWRYKEHARRLVVQVQRNDAELILCEDARRAGGGRLFFSLARGQVARCVEAFSTAGIEVHDSVWGMPVKIVAEPDDNELLFVDDDLIETHDHGAPGQGNGVDAPQTGC